MIYFFRLRQQEREEECIAMRAARFLQANGLSLSKYLYLSKKMVGLYLVCTAEQYICAAEVLLDLTEFVLSYLSIRLCQNQEERRP